MTFEEIEATDRIILGIDPGSSVMGYGVLCIRAKNAHYITAGIIDLRKISNHYLTLQKIFTEVTKLIEQYYPNELAIEAPFFGKNVQSMLKLGRSQGAAITAATCRDIPVVEYAPLKIKQAITGNGQASKEQVANMLCKILKIDKNQLPKELDATDGLAAAYCHFLESTRPTTESKHYVNWKDFANKNASRISKTPGKK
ncbi:MAG: crossover junction endodeoxyribonuclease RuvC [Bacteroidales bacterium]|nr:crossover junction endodeoxyribonuclease RuvC [Bacteroidales bacterium]